MPRKRNDDHEVLRVHLVALASEAVVLGALIDQELTRVGAQAGTDEVRHASWQHRMAAEAVLAGDTSPGEPSLSALCGAVDAFHTRLADLRHLRECVEDMDPSHAHAPPRYPQVWRVQVGTP